MFWTVTQSLFDALGQTAEIFFLTLLFGLPLGLVVAFGSMSKWQPFRFLLQPKKRKDSGTPTAETDLAPVKQEPSKFIKALAAFRPIHTITDVVVWVIRGTPLMLQLIIIFYGPGTWFGTNPWNAFRDGRMTACCIAFIINYACYFSVIYRGGIEGVPAGQREAGEVLGLTKRQISLLQMVKRVIPPMSNEIITLVKDTSLARTIAIIEITMAGEAFMKSKGITWPLFYTGVFYLAFVGLLTLLFSFIERKLSYFK